MCGSGLTEACPVEQPTCVQVPQANGCDKSYRPATIREQAEKSVHYHYEQAEKQNRAAYFLRENPAFDEFIQLIRSGAIQI